MSRYGWLVAIACAYLYIFPYFPRFHSTNELPRVLLVEAIVDDHTFVLNRGVARYGRTYDMAPFGDELYSNKAPGSSLLVAPAYRIVRLFGEPSLAGAMWLCRVVAGIAPALAFLVLLRRFLARLTPDVEACRLTIVAYALGSLAMTYAVLYYGHQLSAVCVASAWILGLDVADRRRGLRAMAAAGLLLGFAPVVDYQAAFAGVPVAACVLVRMRKWPRQELMRAVVVAAAAAAVPIAVLLAYHDVCFGSPFRTGYDAPLYAEFTGVGFLGVTQPRWGSLVATTVDPSNGLLALSPWFALAIPGTVTLWRRGERAIAVVGAATAAIYLLFMASLTYGPTPRAGGWEVGPRYLTAMLPFLLPAIAAQLAAWRSRPWLVGAVCGTIVFGVVVYALSAATFPYWPDYFSNPLYDVTFRVLGDNLAAPNLGGACGLDGVVGLLPYLALVAGVVGVAIKRLAGWRGVLLAVAVGAAIVAAFGLWPRGGDLVEWKYRHVLRPTVVER